MSFATFLRLSAAASSSASPPDNLAVLNDAAPLVAELAGEAMDVMITTITSAQESITQLIRSLNDKLWWRSRVLILALFVGLSYGAELRTEAPLWLSA